MSAPAAERSAGIETPSQPTQVRIIPGPLAEITQINDHRDGTPNRAGLEDTAERFDTMHRGLGQTALTSGNAVDPHARVEPDINPQSVTHLLASTTPQERRLAVRFASLYVMSRGLGNEALVRMGLAGIMELYRYAARGIPIPERRFIALTSEDED